MSASASASPLVTDGVLVLTPPSARTWLSHYLLSTSSGWAEAQRLEHGPRSQGVDLVGRTLLQRHPSTPEGSVLEAQQELEWGMWMWVFDGGTHDDDDPVAVVPTQTRNHTPQPTHHHNTST